MEFVTDDQTGFVKNAVLTLRARMIRIHLKQVRDTFRSVQNDWAQRLVLPYGEEQDWDLYAYIDFDFPLPLIQTGFKYFLLLMVTGITQSDPAFGLVVELSNTSDTTFRRVGYTSFGSGDTEKFRNIRVEEASYPCDKYNLATGRHLIRLI
jgi:hypothetical protein